MLLSQRVDEKDKVTDKTLEKVVHLTSEFQRYMSLSYMYMHVLRKNYAICFR